MLTGSDRNTSRKSIASERVLVQAPPPKRQSGATTQEVGFLVNGCPFFFHLQSTSTKLASWCFPISTNLILNILCTIAVTSSGVCNVCIYIYRHEECCIHLFVSLSLSLSLSLCLVFHISTYIIIHIYIQYIIVYPTSF